MQKIQFFIRYALHGLIRGGQRTFVAILSVVFGVMSLAAMSLMSFSIINSLHVEPESSLGGDLSIWSGQPLGVGDFATLDQLQADGVITAYSPQAPIRFQVLMRNNVSARANYVNEAMAIDPSTYPLKGALTINEPINARLADLLAELNSTVITLDVASSNQLAIGDTIQVTYLEGNATPIALHVTGIVDDNPSHSGGTLYYSLETAQQFYNTPQFITNVKLNAENVALAQQTLAAQGWDTYTVADVSSSETDFAGFFDTMLKGAGILGLIVGGIGIANTMQVLLSQRVREVAILKTLGYSQRDMITLFMLEAALMGIIGALIGVALGVFISQGLVQLFANVSTVLIAWRLDIPLLLGSVMVGVVSTVLFAMYAIVRTSGVRPAMIFRQQAIELNKMEWAKALGFYALLAIPFAVITSLIFGSVIEGVGVLIFALVGLIVLGLALGFAMWLTLRVMPTFRFRLLYMARNHMRKRGFSLLFAMIALFVGIYTLGFAMAVIQISLDQADIRSDITTEYNLSLMAQAQDAETAINLLNAEGAADIHARHLYGIESLTVNIPNNGETGSEISNISARDTLWDNRVVEGEAYGALENAVYLNAFYDAEIGSPVQIETHDGRTIMAQVGGFVERISFESTLTPDNRSNVLVSPDLFAQVVDDAAARSVYYATLPANQVNDVATRIGQALPSTLIMTSTDFIETLNNAFNNLFILAVAMAGLALLAGLMLVANVVSLAMIRRRYEIGVMKAVGYTRGNILTTLALEYGIIALIASAAGLLAVQITLLVLVMTQSPSMASALIMKPITVVIILAVGVGLTMITALATAWRPTQVRPISILNEGVA